MGEGKEPARGEQRIGERPRRDGSRKTNTSENTMMKLITLYVDLRKKSKGGRKALKSKM